MKTDAQSVAQSADLALIDTTGAANESQRLIEEESKSLTTTEVLTPELIVERNKSLEIAEKAEKSTIELNQEEFE